MFTHQNAKKESNLRLFFAIWPDNPLKNALYRLQRDCIDQHILRGGSKIAPDNLHITLQFLGSQPVSRLHALIDIATVFARHAEISPFELHLDHLGYWQKPRVLYLGVSKVPASLSRLAAGLGQQTILLPAEKLTKFNPHLSLFRKVAGLKSGDQNITRFPPDCIPLSILKREIHTLSWQVERFSLVQSFTYPEGVEYKILHEWALNG